MLFYRQVSSNYNTKILYNIKCNVTVQKHQILISTKLQFTIKDKTNSVRKFKVNIKQLTFEYMYAIAHITLNTM